MIAADNLYFRVNISKIKIAKKIPVFFIFWKY